MILFFAAGFLFDATMLKRIDDAPMLIQQGAYLGVVGAVLALTAWIEAREIALEGLLGKAWSFRDALVHFMLGTLLNAYALFYLKSASGTAAVLFFVLIAGLLALNELPYFHRMGPVVLFGLYGFCLTSYFAYLIPVLVGHIRAWMFYASVVAGSLVLLALAHRVAAWAKNRRVALKQVVLPGLCVQLLLVGLYGLSLIPPVPLAVEQIGIYHEVTRTQDGHYLLAHAKPPWWEFWTHDDADFVAREGDRIYCFARIFAPRDFRDRVYIRWEREDPKKGWVKWDSVPLTIVGGREKGFRGYAYKAHFEPGHWRVTVVSEDGRDVGDEEFTVTHSDDTTPRTWVETQV